MEDLWWIPALTAPSTSHQQHASSTTSNMQQRSEGGFNCECVRGNCHPKTCGMRFNIDNPETSPQHTYLVIINTMNTTSSTTVFSTERSQFKNKSITGSRRSNSKIGGVVCPRAAASERLHPQHATRQAIGLLGYVTRPLGYIRRP